MSQPKTVMLCSNRMVLVFDAAGDQMPALQGQHEHAKTKLASLNLDGCEFIKADWIKRSQLPMTREEFFNWDS